MSLSETLLWEGDTAQEHYQVVDTIYTGRPARVLYSGDRMAAQSGMALDNKPELLFDYNERFMELIRGRRPAHLLLIGGGAYTLPMAIRQEFPAAWIDVVEKDEGLQELAERFFGLRTDGRLRITHAEGRAYLENTREHYDLIIIDAFRHERVPRQLATLEAAQAAVRRLAPDGLLAMNVISAYEGLRAVAIRQLAAAYGGVFPRLEVFPAGRLISGWFPQNLVLVVQRSEDPVQPFMRFGALPPLRSLGAEEALRDEVLRG